MVVYNGTYRGVVIDIYDPSGMNRIRVQVPQVLGSNTSGWAYPAWSIHDMSIWPEDRFPKPGEGVWIRFESPDRMNWIGTFGLPEPPLYDPLTAFTAKIFWTIPWLPYNVDTAIKGWVRSPSGTPNPEPMVALMQNNTVPDAGGNYVWTQVATAPVVLDLSRPNSLTDPKDPDGDGSFNITFKRTIVDPVPVNLKYMIRFLETGGFAQQDSDIQKTIQPDKDLAVYWNAGDPAWATAKTISGYVVPGPAGLPTPCKIELRVRKQATTPWTVTGIADVMPNNSWSITHTRTDAAAIEYQTTFIGHSGWNTDVDPDVPKQYAAVSSTPTLTWDLPGKTMLVGVPITISGTLNSTYGVPSPSTVNFQAKVGSTWTTKVSAAANTLGNWTLSFTPAADATEYRVQYPGSGIWTAVTISPTYTRTLVFPTTTTVSTFASTIPLTSSFTVSGTVTETTGGKAVTRGEVQLWYRLTKGSDTAWYATGAATVVPNSSGAYTLSHGAIGVAGGFEFKVKYLGDGGSFPASESTVYPRTLTVGGVTTVNKGAITSTTAVISWAAVSGIDQSGTAIDGQYNLYKNGAYLTSVSASTLSYTYTGLATNTDYTFEVLTDAKDYGDWADGSGTIRVYGPMSPSVKMNTGKAAVTKSGSFTDHAVPCTDSNAHRDDVGWNYLTGADVGQGYWSSSASRYCGVMTYDDAAFRSWVSSTYGSDVVANLNFTSCKVVMKRTGSGGDNAANTIYWWLCNVVPESSTTIDLAYAATTNGAAWGNTVTCTLPDDYAYYLLQAKSYSTIATVQSFAIYKNAGGAAYQIYEGYTTSGACDMTVSASWSFTSAAAVAAKWY